MITTLLRSTTGLILAITLVVAGTVACSGSGESTSAEYLEHAKEYQDKGQLREAVIELKNALSQDPKNIEARWLLGTIYLEIDDGAAAEKELRRASELGLAREAAAIFLTRALLMQGKYQQVVDDPLRPEVLPKDSRAELWALKGNGYYGLGELAQAEKLYAMALSINPENTEASTGVARLAAVKNQLDVARGQIEKVLEASPRYAPAWSLLGDIEANDRRFGPAEQAYGKAIELQHHVTMDRIKRARMRLKLGDRKGADEDIEVVKKAGIKHPLLSYVEGIMYFGAGRYDEAGNAFQASLDQDPGSVKAKMYLAIVSFLQGNYERASLLTEQLRYDVPGSGSVDRLQAAILIRRSEFKEAQAVLEKTLNKNPKDALVLLLLGSVALAEGRAADGIDYFEKVSMLQPDSNVAPRMLRIAKLMDHQKLEPGTPLDANGRLEAEQYEQVFMAALSEFRQGNYQKALESARALHQSNPDQIDPRNLMAACYLAMGQWEQARKELEKVLEIAPTEPSAIKNLARIDLREGDVASAKELLDRLLSERPDDIEAITLLVDAETRLGYPQRVIDLLESTVARNPDESSLRLLLVTRHYEAGDISDVMRLTRNLSDQQVQKYPDFLQFRGKAEMLSGEVFAAKRSFKRLVEEVPDSPRARFLYADSLAGSGEMEPALEQIQRAVELDPGYLAARVAEVRLLVELGKGEQAQKALSDVKQRFGDRPEVLGVEGAVALLKGDFAQAARQLAQSLEEDPQTETAVRLIAALWGLGEYDEAIDFMQGWTTDHPGDLRVLMHLAGGYLSLGREADARLVYTKIVELYPGNVSALNNLAWLSREQNLEQAIGYAEKALELAPKDAQVADTLGVLLMQRGDVERGYRQLENAAALSAEDPEIQLHLASALLQLKKYKEARKVLNQLVSGKPESEFSTEAAALLDSIPSD